MAVLFCFSRKGNWLLLHLSRPPFVSSAWRPQEVDLLVVGEPLEGHALGTPTVDAFA